MRLGALSLCLLSAALAPGCAGARGGDGAAYAPGVGPYAVGEIQEVVLRDSARGKDLPLRIRYPDAPGPFPVIVWSHGAGGSKDNYAILTEHWASHGYVVIQPTHEDSRQLGGRLRDMRNLNGWQGRPRDVSFVIDSLGELAAQQTALAGKLDAARIGVGGHSFGAHTAQLIGGAHSFGRAGEQSFFDARVKSVMLLSGQGPGEMLTETSWRTLARPMLVMSGSRDGPTRTGQPAEWRRQPYELSPPGDKHLIWIEGLDHGYGGISGVRRLRNPRNDDHVRYTQIATLCFWDTYLKDSAEARSYLLSRKLIALSGGSIEMQHK
jgi:predicted dienelactone hydrolase